MSDNYEEAARAMANMLYADSLIPIDESYPQLLEALQVDMRIPTFYEQECLTMGGPLNAETDEDHPDTYGEGAPDIDDSFPATLAVIESFF